MDGSVEWNHHGRPSIVRKRNNIPWEKRPKSLRYSTMQHPIRRLAILYSMLGVTLALQCGERSYVSGRTKATAVGRLVQTLLKHSRLRTKSVRPSIYRNMCMSSSCESVMPTKRSQKSSTYMVGKPPRRMTSSFAKKLPTNGSRMDPFEYMDFGLTASTQRTTRRQ